MAWGVRSLPSSTPKKSTNGDPNPPAQNSRTEGGSGDIAPSHPKSGELRPNGAGKHSPHKKRSVHGKMPCTGHKNKSRKTPYVKKRTFQVLLTPEGRDATEEDRRAQMAALALCIATAPSSSSAPPVAMSGDGLVSGSVVLTCDNEDSMVAVREMLDNQEGWTVSTRTGVQRFIFGVPGYMVHLTGEQVTALMERQNPGMTRGGFYVVSQHSGPRHTVFVDLREDVQQFLETVGFSLNTLTSTVRLRPLESDKPSPK